LDGKTLSAFLSPASQSAAAVPGRVVERVILCHETSPVV